MSFCQQFNTLLKRQFTNYWRSPSYNVTRGMVCIIVAMIFGTILMKPRPGSVNTYTDSFSFMGVMYLDTFFMAIIFYSSAIPNMVCHSASHALHAIDARHPTHCLICTSGFSIMPQDIPGGWMFM